MIFFFLIIYLIGAITAGRVAYLWAENKYFSDSEQFGALFGLFWPLALAIVLFIKIASSKFVVMPGDFLYRKFFQ